MPPVYPVRQESKTGPRISGEPQSGVPVLETALAVGDYQTIRVVATNLRGSGNPYGFLPSATSPKPGVGSGNAVS